MLQKNGWALNHIQKQINLYSNRPFSCKEGRRVFYKKWKVIQGESLTTYIRVIESDMTI